HIKFDIIHVDGGHGIEVCRTDISNSIRLSSKRSILIIDDTNNKHISNVYWEYVRWGFLLPQREYKLEQTNSHEISEIITIPDQI
ncbi:hypothetical protein V6O07_19620, partial [Arthrospira platensis SPKY2]